ncbi:hypothetical protein [Terrabacter sp. MAHUQ-38]|uniref:hypothetical protein n=1 Tax=unclassified Terrabacter TaxID=2630222 RepID=UPI001CAA6C43|nr:hypothetical protein [Terrabacter sp. MAHUQ-38]
MSETVRMGQQYQELRARTEILVAEWSERVPAGVVIATVARCRKELFRAGVRDGLAAATEELARRRLQSQAPPTSRSKRTK